MIDSKRLLSLLGGFYRQIEDARTISKSDPPIGHSNADAILRGVVSALADYDYGSDQPAIQRYIFDILKSFDDTVKWYD